MASFYRSDVARFLRQSPSVLLATLASSYAGDGYTSQYSDQTLAWQRDLEQLQAVLRACVAHSSTAERWGLVLEFEIPRKARRIDIVLLVRETIVLIEAKTSELSSAAKQQAEVYALLLHYFHKGSANYRIVPVVVSSAAGTPDWIALRQRELYPQMASYWISPVVDCSWNHLSSLLLELEQQTSGQVSLNEWERSSYLPVPSIIEYRVREKHWSV